MIEYFEGTVFNTKAEAIVNTVNCDGFMGAGLALEFALRYPKMFEDYEIKCKNNIIQVGKIDTYKTEDVLIINFPTKNIFKFPSHIKWIESGLQNFVDTYSSYNIKSVAFPKLGCSNGGLNWEEVKELMKKYLSDIDLKVYICEDTISIAQGKEKEMLDNFNSIPVNELTKVVKLSEKQIYAIQSNKPYKRFWQIANTQSIGKTTYKNLFQYFYQNNITQTKLF